MTFYPTQRDAMLTNSRLGPDGTPSSAVAVVSSRILWNLLDRTFFSLRIHTAIFLMVKQNQFGMHSLQSVYSCSNSFLWRSLLRNWDWNIKSAHMGQRWLILFCSDSYQGCPQAYAEWERAFQLIGPFVRMGRVNVNEQYRLVNNFMIRYVPAIYVVADGEMNPYQGYSTADSLYSMVRGTILNHFQEIRNLEQWKQVFNWEARLDSTGTEAPERVQVVLYTTDRHIPLKWRYWADKYYDMINFYAIYPSTTMGASLISMLGASYGVHQCGVALLFPNPRDNSDVIILSDPDIDGQHVELTSTEVKDWLESYKVPKLAKLDENNFLHIVQSNKLTLAMAVDVSIGGSSDTQHYNVGSSGFEYAQSSKYGNSRLKRFGRLLEPMSTLWEQRRENSVKDLQFAWFSTTSASIIKTLRLKKARDGQLFLIDRSRMEFAAIPLDIDSEEVSAFVNLFTKYSGKKLQMQRLAHVPQSTDNEWSFKSALATAGSFLYVSIGLVIVLVGGIFVVSRASSSSSASASASSAKDRPASESSSSTGSSRSSTSNGSQSSSSKPKPEPSSQTGSSNQSKASPSNGAVPEFFKISNPNWRELRLETYDSIVGMKNFTMILFPRMDQHAEVRQWDSAVRSAAYELSTDSVSFAYAHSHLQKRYSNYWRKYCDHYLQGSDETKAQSCLGILLHAKKQRFVIYSSDITSTGHVLDSSRLVAFIQRVLEGQANFVDIPADAPSVGS